MTSIRILTTPHGSRILAENMQTVWHMDTPCDPNDLHALIFSAFKAPDNHPRTELNGVVADKTESGIRVRVVANTCHFDIPWQILARGIDRK